jgi:hypothetical protein
MKTKFLLTATIIAMCITGCGDKPKSMEPAPKPKEPALPDSTMEKLDFFPEYKPASQVPKHICHFITIEEFDAPPGAATGNLVPGKYVVKGSYNFQCTNIFGAQTPTIHFFFWGRWVYVPEFTQDKFQIPPGQTNGTFELSQGIREWQGGIGVGPCVELNVPRTVEEVKLRINTNAPLQGKH